MFANRSDCSAALANVIYRCPTKTIITAFFIGGWFMLGMFLRQNDTANSHLWSSVIDPSSGIITVPWRSPRSLNATALDKQPAVHINSKNQSKSKVGNILLMAYQRSGSSFLGEILSTPPKTFYAFEPLIEFSCKRGIKEPNAVAEVIKNIFNCDQWTLNALGPARTATIQMLRKRGTIPGCQTSRIRVIKTIRIRAPVAHLLLKDDTLNMRIVHLVRDPRAILNSMNSSDTWRENQKTPKVQCSQLLNDILFAEHNFPKDRYLRIRYEDVVSEPLIYAVKIFQFLNIPLPHQLAFYLATHTEAERFYRSAKINYFSTIKKSNYDPNNWKTSLSRERIREIESEESCARVMEILNYSRL